MQSVSRFNNLGSTSWVFHLHSFLSIFVISFSFSFPNCSFFFSLSLKYVLFKKKKNYYSFIHMCIHCLGPFNVLLYYFNIFYFFVHLLVWIDYSNCVRNKILFLKEIVFLAKGHIFKLMPHLTGTDVKFTLVE
jgi:hypothetical protein